MALHGERYRLTMLGRKVESLVFQMRSNLWRVNWKRLFYRLEDIRIHRPIFLLGTQGGGLTLVSRILRRSRNIVSCTGNARYWLGADEMQNVCRMRLPMEFRLRGHPAFRGDDLGAGWRYASDRYYNFFRKDRCDYSEEVGALLRKVIKDLVLFYGGHQRQVRFIDKSQSFTLKIPLLNEILREEQPSFLLITRNPYAMCLRAATTTALSRLPMSHGERISIAGQHWRNSMETALKDGRKAESFHWVRFEDLLTHPEKTLREVCEFLELPYCGELLPAVADRLPFGSIRDAKWYPLRPDVNDRYLERMTTEDRARIQSYCGELGELFRYLPDGTA